MPFIYITGPSGAGKSTVHNELIARGYEAHDTDEDGMSAWFDNQTLARVEFLKAQDRPADWFEKHDFFMTMSFAWSSIKTPWCSASQNALQMILVNRRMSLF